MKKITREQALKIQPKRVPNLILTKGGWALPHPKGNKVIRSVIYDVPEDLIGLEGQYKGGNKEPEPKPEYDPSKTIVKFDVADPLVKGDKITVTISTFDTKGDQFEVQSVVSVTSDVLSVVNDTITSAVAVFTIDVVGVGDSTILTTVNGVESDSKAVNAITDEVPPADPVIDVANSKSTPASTTKNVDEEFTTKLNVLYDNGNFVSGAADIITLTSTDITLLSTEEKSDHYLLTMKCSKSGTFNTKYKVGDLELGAFKATIKEVEAPTEPTE